MNEAQIQFIKTVIAASATANGLEVGMFDNETLRDGTRVVLSEPGDSKWGITAYASTHRESGLAPEQLVVNLSCLVANPATNHAEYLTLHGVSWDIATQKVCLDTDSLELAVTALIARAKPAALDLLAEWELEKQARNAVGELRARFGIESGVKRISLADAQATLVIPENQRSPADIRVTLTLENLPAAQMEAILALLGRQDAPPAKNAA